MSKLTVSLRHAVSYLRGTFLLKWDEMKLSPQILLTSGAVWLFIIVYIVLLSWLSLHRYDAFGASALDLGYVDQMVWNIRHGRFFHSTVLEDVTSQLPSHPSIAYHFRLILVPLSLLYLVQSSPKMLLVVQAIILGLGALPVFWLARDRLSSRLGGLVFALAYLLLPAVGWASVSGFHSLALAATFLLFAFYFMQKRSYVAFLVFAILSLASREDVFVFVALMGIYVLIVGKEKRIGIGTVVLSVGWFLLTTLLIIPYYNYSGTLTVLREYEWLGISTIHESAPIFAAIVICAIYGLGFLSEQLPRRLSLSQQGTTYTLLGVVLVSTCFYHYQAGASPLARHYDKPEITAHHLLANEVVDLIPDNASLSTQSSLLPRLSQRQNVYLFPAFSDTQYILLDVTATPYPLEVEGVFQEATRLLNSGEYGVVASRDGYILMRRDSGEANTLSEEFYSFTKADVSEVKYPYFAEFGQVLQLVGYDYQILHEPDSKNPSIAFTTYWRALNPPQKDYRLAFFFRKKDGAVDKTYVGGSATTLWYPTTTWPADEILKIETPPLLIEGFRYVDMAVVEPSDGTAKESRLSPIESPEGRPLTLNEDGTLLQLVDLKEPPRPGRLQESQLPSLPPTATPSPYPTPSPTPSPIPSPYTCPLCGRGVGESGFLTFPPLAVKIDNASKARPQSGLSQACIVYEHLTEWGVTRFTAIYFCQTADTIGPIRSARLIDLDLVRQYKAVFAHVGASRPIMDLLRTSGLHDLDQWWYPDAYYRSSSYPSPYNVYSSTARLHELVLEKGWKERVLLDHGSSFDKQPPGNGTTVSRVTIPYSEYSRVEYRYDEKVGSYLRSVAGQPHVDANSGEQISVSNVVVQWAKSWETDIIEDSLGGRSLQFELVGEGRAEIFRDGQVISARWVRTNPDELTRFLDDEGKPVPFKPGNIWVSIVPIGMEIGKSG